MKKILVLALLAGGAYGVYWLLEMHTGGAADRAAKEVSGGHLERAQRQLEYSRTKIDRATVETVRDAIRRFNADFNRNPKSLEELFQADYLDSMPAGVTYDPATGEVKAGG